MYDALVTEDWITLWGLFISWGVILGSGSSLVIYYVLLHDHLTGHNCSPRVYRNAQAAFIVISFLFSLTFSWTLGLFDTVSIYRALLTVLVIGLLGSLSYWWFLKGTRSYCEKWPLDSRVIRRRTRRIHKLADSIRKQNKALELEVDEAQILIEAQELAGKRDLLMIRVLCSTVIAFCLIIFFPYVFAYLFVL